MGLKKNNPGCACCGGRILVWDVGFTVNGISYNFKDFHVVEEWYNDEFGTHDDEGNLTEPIIDFVTGSSDPSPAEDFYDLNPDFNPYTTAVEAGHWTGDIFDYSLIFWPQPMSSDEVDDACGVARQGHEFWGGEPDWWDDVASGRWKGRLVFITYGTATKNGSFFDLPSPLFPQINVFINELSAQTGMEIDTELAFLEPRFDRTCSLQDLHCCLVGFLDCEPGDPEYISTVQQLVTTNGTTRPPREVIVSGDDPLSEDCEDWGDIEADQLDIVAFAPSEVDGGTPVFTLTNAYQLPDPYCDFVKAIGSLCPSRDGVCGTQIEGEEQSDRNWVVHNTVEKTQQDGGTVLVDYVIWFFPRFTDMSCTEGFLDAITEHWRTQLRQFYFNLHTKPIALVNEVST